MTIKDPTVSHLPSVNREIPGEGFRPPPNLVSNIYSILFIGTRTHNFRG